MTMLNNKTDFKVYITPRTIYRLLFMLVIISCSPRTGHKVLSVFFDGVPSDDTNRNLASSFDTIHSNKNVVTSLNSIKIADSVHYHQPYRESKCDVCHQQDKSINMYKSQEEMCYACHTNYPQKFEFVHSPVADGMCTRCHSPHFSKNPSLLLAVGNDNCTKCHSKQKLAKDEVHLNNSDKLCTNCHDPHGGSDHFRVNEK